MLGLIEAGGTKFVLAYQAEKGKLSSPVSLPTLSPAETIPQVINYFKSLEKPLSALAIASFGPIDINHASKSYGYITNSPKLAWQNYNFVGAFASAFPNIPIVFDTDVNLAALGEYALSVTEIDSLLYLTIGTGVGGGYVKNGQIINSYGHPEMGHLLIVPNPEDHFTGICPFHKNCLEGMLAGPSLFARYGRKGQDLPEEHPIWPILADYLAQALLAYTVILRPERIKLGGGVMQKANFVNLVRAKFLERLNGYLTIPDIEKYIDLPKANGKSALLGCLNAIQQRES